MKLHEEVERLVKECQREEGFPCEDEWDRGYVHACAKFVRRMQRILKETESDDD